jgi:single-strand DNA-binding protein
LSRATLTVEGNVGREPDIRFSKTGKAITKFNVAVTERVKEPNGTYSDGETMWVQVVCFGALAEDSAEAVKKGARVVAGGRAKMEEWTDKDGGKRTTLVLLADWVGLKPPRSSPPQGRPAEGGREDPARPKSKWVDEVAPF